MDIKFDENSVEDQVKKRVSKKTKPKKELDLLIPTGSTLYNLVLSDKHDGGYLSGTAVNLIGDSDSGKTFTAMTMLATIINDERFDDYKVYFDNAELHLAFDMEKFFGKKAAKRIISPYGKSNDRQASDTAQDFAGSLFKKLDKGEPFIYVLDSFDALSSTEEQKRYKKTYIKNNEEEGSYKTEKPRLLSELLRVTKKPLSDTKSLLNIISQTRDNLSFGAKFKPKIRSGGKALKFYCMHETWTTCGKIFKEPKKPPIGVESMLKTTKNHLTGKKRDCEIPIFYDLGLDEVTSCVNYLIEKGWWKRGSVKGEKNLLVLSEFDKKMGKNEIVEFIENNNLEKELSEITGNCWKNIEDSLKLTNRKRRFQ